MRIKDITNSNFSSEIADSEKESELLRIINRINIFAPDWEMLWEVKT